MKFAVVRIKNRAELAVATENGLISLNSLKLKRIENPRLNMSKLMRDNYYIELIEDAICEMDSELEYLNEDEYTFQSVVGKPEKIICLGLNYKAHINEVREDLPNSPILFSKFNNSLAGHGSEIHLPDASKQVDYEGELGIVIGKAAENVSEEEALDYVFGYFIANDVSARDLQFRTGQWLLGKSCDRFLPNGPFLVTRDEIEDPQDLRIRTFVNGEKRQDATTAQMIFSCRETISYISRHLKLKPGDIISTGTPDGVILGMPEDKRHWLKNGDVVEVEIEKLGKLRNKFVSR